MASINGIQLKNIKKRKNNIHKGRIDMDGKPIGYFSLCYIDGRCINVRIDITANSHKYLEGDVSLENYEEYSIIIALNLDSKNKEEFSRRIELYYKEKNQEDIFGLDQTDLIAELFNLRMKEMSYFYDLAHGKRKRKKSFDLTENWEV